MPALNVVASFQDPNRLAYMSSLLLNVRALVNASTEGKGSRVRLIGTPGLTQICKPVTTSTVSTMALGKAQGTVWAIFSDGSVWHDVQTASPIQVGNLGAGRAQSIVRVDEDITGLIATTDAAHGFLITTAGVTDLTTTGWTEPPDGTGTPAGHLAPTACAELDNMAVWGGFQGAQKLQMQRSEPLAPGESDALWFASKEARADALVDLVSIDRFLWALGADSIEPFYDEGTSTTFPFTNYPNAMNEVGILARGSLAHCFDTGWFVGTNFMVWQLQGLTATAISPDWVNILLEQTNPATLTALAYSIGGDIFYVLTSEGAWSVEYSVKNALWNFRASPGRNDFAGRAAITFGEGAVCLIGTDTGEICKVDINSASEPAGQIPRMIISPPVGSQEVKNTVLQVDMTSSMGPGAGNFTLDWSEDNQQTWRGARSIQFPTPGVQRAIGRGFGNSRMRNFRWRYQGTQAPFTIDSLFILHEEGV